MSDKLKKNQAGTNIISNYNWMMGLKTGEGKLIDTDISTTITNPGTAAKFRAMIATKVSKVRAIHVSRVDQFLVDIDRGIKLGLITDAIVETARAAGASNATNLRDAIALKVPHADKTVQPRSVWA